MYLFSSNDDERYYLCSNNIKKLKSEIIKWYNKTTEGGLLFFKVKYGAVIEEYGDVIGWIKKIKEVK